MYSETVSSLMDDLGLEVKTIALDMLESGDSKLMRDTRMNLKSVLESEHLSRKEALLTALATAVALDKHDLQEAFKKLAEAEMASAEELADAVAAGSLLSLNNVFYRFRHFAGKESYRQMPARLRMNVMRSPAIGKELFELISLAVSAVNGCETCVRAHEASVLELGSSEARIFEAVRLAAVVTGLSKVV